MPFSDLLTFFVIHDEFRAVKINEKRNLQISSFIYTIISTQYIFYESKEDEKRNL